MNFIEDFRAAMAASGLEYAGNIIADGRIHRFKCVGDHDDNSWFCLYNDERPAGSYGCWKRQIKKTWCSNGSKLSPEEFDRAKARWKQIEAQRAAEQNALHARSAQRTREFIAFLKPATSHPYLEKKNVSPHGDLRVDVDNQLVLPITDSAGVIWSYQTIDELGGKLFTPGGRVQGCSFVLHMHDSGPVVICEGYATGATIFEATGYSVVCALNCGNLKAVAMAFKGRDLIIAADNDRFTEGNPGLAKATDVFESLKCRLVVPEFSDTDTTGTDFNDLAKVSGIDHVRKVFEQCQNVPRGELNGTHDTADPLPGNDDPTWEGATPKSVEPIKAVPIGDLQSPVENDPSELLKFRFLCRKMVLLFVGSTGKGKSSFLLQALALWANGKSCFGITPAGKWSSIYIQAENDDGDIAQIRDGICTGLEFTEEERQVFFKNVLVFTETEHSGKRFCNEVLSPLLESHKADIVAIDPALSYLGADNKEGRDVGIFLRNYLAPILSRHNAAAIINHHTNKMSFSDDVEGRDFAYYAGGSAEWGNFPRAILALEGTKNKGVFRLHAAKRGQKLGWKDQEGETLYSRHISHSKDGVICWVEATDDDIQSTGKLGRTPSVTDKEFLQPLESSSRSTVEWRKILSDDLGVSKTVFYRNLDRMKDSGRILKSAINGKWQLVLDRKKLPFGPSPE